MVAGVPLPFFTDLKPYHKIRFLKEFVYLYPLI